MNVLLFIHEFKELSYEKKKKKISNATTQGMQKKVSSDHLHTKLGRYEETCPTHTMWLNRPKYFFQVYNFIVIKIKYSNVKSLVS